MASRALARVARTPDDYRYVYRKALAACERPVILHWLGDMFDAELKGYWGDDAFRNRPLKPRLRWSAKTPSR